MIKLCETDSINTDLAYENAILSHRNDIADWLEEKYSIQICKKSFFDYSIKYLNTRAILYLVNANPSYLTTFPFKKYLPSQILKYFKLSPPISIVFENDCISLFLLLLEYNQNFLDVNPKNTNNHVMKCIIGDSVNILKYIEHELGVNIKDSIPNGINPIEIGCNMRSINVVNYIKKREDMKNYLDDLIKKTEISH